MAWLIGPSPGFDVVFRAFALAAIKQQPALADLVAFGAVLLGSLIAWDSHRATNVIPMTLVRQAVVVVADVDVAWLTDCFRR